MQFIKRPGYGLDDLAVKRAFQMRFEPARDISGKAIPSQRLWKMEWPSYDWLVGDDWQNTATTGWRQIYFGRKIPDMVACADSGVPMNMGEWSPRYRDCTPPDFSVLATAPLITKPAFGGGLKVPPNARLSSLAPEKRREVCQWAADLPVVNGAPENVEACTERVASSAQPVSQFVSCTLARAKGKDCTP
jgi:hypothetical protein